MKIIKSASEMTRSGLQTLCALLCCATALGAACEGGAWETHGEGELSWEIQYSCIEGPGHRGHYAQRLEPAPTNRTLEAVCAGMAVESGSGEFDVIARLLGDDGSADGANP